jgi:hypothetical protein
MEPLKEKQLSLIRRFPLESLIFFMLCGYIFLGGWLSQTSKKVNELQAIIIQFYTVDHDRAVNALEKSNYTIDRSNVTNERVYNALYEFKLSKK